jgi:hypothetical protein
LRPTTSRMYSYDQVKFQQESALLKSIPASE